MTGWLHIYHKEIDSHFHISLNLGLLKVVNLELPCPVQEPQAHSYWAAEIQAVQLRTAVSTEYTPYFKDSARKNKTFH